MQRTLAQSHDNQTARCPTLRRHLTKALDQRGALDPLPPPPPEPERTPECQKLRDAVLEDFERMDHAEKLAFIIRCKAIRIGKDSDALSLELDRLQRDEDGSGIAVLTRMQVVLRSTLAYVRLARSVPLDEPTTQILLENCRKALVVMHARDATGELTLAGIERAVCGLLTASQDIIDDCQQRAERQCAYWNRRLARAADPEERSRVAEVLFLTKAQRRWASGLRGAESVPRDRRPAARRAVRTPRHRRVPRSHRHRAACIGKLAAGDPDPDPEPEPPTTRRYLGCEVAP
jgi:hypothetical protein